MAGDERWETTCFDLLVEVKNFHRVGAITMVGARTMGLGLENRIRFWKQRDCATFDVAGGADWSLQIV